MNPANDSTKSFAAWLPAFFLAVIGSHFWVVWLYGSALPFWDQWDEAVKLFIPWTEGHLRLAGLVAPFNEHRIIPTYFLDLGLICLNGRWDPLLQMTVNAFIHAAFACGLAFCLWQVGGRKQAWLVFGLLLPFFTLPYAGENAIWGFNSMWYFQHLFGLAAIAGLGFCRACTWSWWLGLAAALLGLVTMAMGAVPPVVIAGLFVLRAIKNRQLGRDGWIALGICVALIGLGMALNVSQAGAGPLQAHSFAEFAAAFIRQLDWPFYRTPTMACVILLPLALLLGLYLRPRFPALRAAEWLLTLALWSLLQSALLAFGRANYGELIPASRYTEVFSVLLIASLFACLLLGEQCRSNGLARWAGRLLPLAFAAVVCWGLVQMSDLVAGNLLAQTRAMNLIAEERVAAYLASGDEKALLERPTLRPDPTVALTVLRNRPMQTILPAACLAPSAGQSNGWLGTAARWLLPQAPIITFIGLVWFVTLCGFGPARGHSPPGKVAGWLLLAAGLAALCFVWSNRSLSRHAIEYGLQRQLAESFKSAGSPERAAFHAGKAGELEPGRPISNLPF